MSGRVGQLRLRCTARRTGAARAMRARTRLEGTARHHLPAALDPALDTERRVYVDRLAVRLDFALDDYDDVTVATLWAARVRSALERAIRDGDPAVRSFESEDEFVAAAAAELAERGELSWLFEELGCGTGSVGVLDFVFAFGSRPRVAALARALSSRPVLARALHAHLEPREREIAVGALRGEARWGDRGASVPATAAASRRDRRPDGVGSADPSIIESAERGDGARTTAERRADGRRLPGSAVEAWLEALASCARSGAEHVAFDRAPRAGTVETTASAPSAALDGEPPVAEEVGRGDGRGRRARERKLEPRRGTGQVAEEDARRPGRGSLRTRYAGLAFLYPWLGEYLERDLPAAQPPPGLDPRIAARLWALARLAATDAAGEPIRDPLVWLLAGGSPRGSAPVPPPPESELAELDGPAAELLTAFAELLPGFEGSTPEFVRDRFLSRGGELSESDREDEVLLVLEPDALDAVLGRLPYPRGPFRLVWTPTVHVEVAR